MKKAVMALVIFVSWCLSGTAQEVNDSARIYFRQSRSGLDPCLNGNKERLDSMVAFIRNYSGPDSVYVLEQVRVVGGASPEGSVDINRRLSERRAASIFDYFSSMIEFPDSITTFSFIGRDWLGLYDLVNDDQDVPYREDVLTMLNRIAADIADGENESSDNLNRLKQMHGGVPYLYMYNHLFPHLRASRLYVEYARRPVIHHEPVSVPVCIDYFYDVPSGAFPSPLPVFRHCRPFYMGLKTNMLYDIMAIPNIGAEFYLGKNWSIAGNWMYGWWKTDRRHRYWRAYGGDIALRWWFGSKAHEKPLTGHHIGVYGGIVTYDFEFGGRGYMGGKPGGTLWDRCQHIAGIEYGYSLPVARRLNIDFTIGFGYMGGKYLEYAPEGDCYEWKSTHNLTWLGPTKAEISLVWLIGCGNYNRVKGGR